LTPSVNSGGVFVGNCGNNVSNGILPLYVIWEIHSQQIPIL